MQKLLIAVLICLLLGTNAGANVCGFAFNPCNDNGKSELNKAKCAAFSDFIFDAEVISFSQVDRVSQSDDISQRITVKQNQAQLKISGWVKGKALNSLGNISYDIQDGYICAGVKTIQPPLKLGDKVKIYGVYLNSQNYCKAAGGDISSCLHGPRSDDRYYWLIDPLN